LGGGSITIIFTTWLRIISHMTQILSIYHFSPFQLIFSTRFTLHIINVLWRSTPQRIFFLSIQHKLFYIVMAFGRFNLYANSYAFLFKSIVNGRRSQRGSWTWILEIICLVLFWTWYAVVLNGCGSWTRALGYLLVSHITTSPIHVQIVLSHFSRSTDDLGPVESFVHRQLRTTSDVICPPYLAFLHGGLDLQVTHHLFPRLPRHNLRKASKLVKEFAKEQGLEYAEFGFVQGNHEVHNVLKGVAEQVALLGKVAQANAHEAVQNINAMES